ncbi:MAG: asparagine synthase [Gomphosphaeria aponina SAG 52.96 = DSM 107014]|uniref:asparagine synthase (glutamine-hydrolyzing) n=1 Tax=Gomphosphaeria aponina SAG 52.96 = DSM 107014 TaxID=1521640 RepID=A0A941GQY6_9CHRO|nr:asparagine synthase [Gomphosphaeria aponina SAG 52.96 = DSM 107014]
MLLDKLTISGNYHRLISENNTGLIVSISAGGTSSLDAWVEVQHDCLILAREPFGKFPLYWLQLPKVVWFASHFQLLLPLITPIVNTSALYGYSCFSYVPTPLTPVEGIYSVAAGTKQIFRGGESSSEVFYQWQTLPQISINEDEAITQLPGLLKNSIERQVADLPDEPVGVLLSGGLDSSIVAALLVQAGVKVRAYTLDFGAFGMPEYPYAAQVATHLHIPLIKVAATPRKIKAALVATVKALGLPFGDGVTVPLYLLCQAASEETRIIFNGEGGDQLFAGWTNKPIIAASVYNSEHPGGTADFTEQYLRTFRRLYGYESRVFQFGVGFDQPRTWIENALDSSFSHNLMDRLRRATLMLKGAQNIHPRATNLAFAHGLWVRSPFCDLPLAEWTFRLPGDLLLRGACEKYILKRAVESWLPPDIVWREKRGMGVPLTEWCLGELWSMVGSWLNPGILLEEGRFLPQLPLQVILGKLGGQIRGRRVGEILWLLIMWQVWRTHVLGEKPTRRSLNNPFYLPYWFWKFGH